ncbi:hypothetical protein BDR06DRAFT_965514 [Suillus hirtellus]|nr:hypothetical protein BDR06DRAFT_965514 [Suillus hirtellus]
MMVATVIRRLSCLLLLTTSSFGLWLIVSLLWAYVLDDMATFVRRRGLFAPRFHSAFVR